MITKKQHKNIKSSIFDIILIVFAIVIVFFIEYFLHLIGFGESYSLANTKTVNGKNVYEINENFPHKYFSTNIKNSPKFKPQSFQIEKKPNTFRIFIVGGNVATGVPYDKSITLTNMLNYSLEKINPDINFEIIDLTVNSFSSFAVADIIKKTPKYKPNLIIINTGYNEFFGIPNAPKLYNYRLEYFLVKSFIYFRQTRIYQLIETIINYFSEQTINEINYLQADYSNDKIKFQSKQYLQKRKDFLRNLYKIESITSKYKIPVMISSVSSNISDIPPFQSLFNDEELTDINLNSEIKHYLTQGQNTRATDWLEDLKSWEPQSAIYYYSKANLDKKNNQIKSSLRNYTIAIRIDQFHFRPLEDWNFAIKNFAYEKKWIFVDINSLYDKKTDNKLNCDKIFVDHIHPNIYGYWLFVNEHILEMHENNLPNNSTNHKLTFKNFQNNYPITNFTKMNQKIYSDKINNYTISKKYLIKKDYNINSIATNYAFKHINNNLDWKTASMKLLKYYNDNEKKEEAMKCSTNILRAYPNFFEKGK
ncbi:MAG: hypothetical protein U9N76_00155 [Candidatus Marinimicrobia bacterium]|nr:hypothetical protein [Candidatus Neomarinimicrobiota bacterium]